MNDIKLKIFIDEIYKLKTLQRYNNKQKIIQENVAEHLFFTAIIVLKLSDKYKFDVLKALKMALIHDLGEIYTGDLTHDVKKKYPKLKEILFNCEYQSILENFNKEYADIFKEFEINETSIEVLIVELADVLSVVQYTKQEITLGNKGYMLEVYLYSIKRANVLKSKIKEFFKNAKK